MRLATGRRRRHGDDCFAGRPCAASIFSADAGTQRPQDCDAEDGSSPSGCLRPWTALPCPGTTSPGWSPLRLVTTAFSIPNGLTFLSLLSGTCAILVAAATPKLAGAPRHLWAAGL